MHDKVQAAIAERGLGAVRHHDPRRAAEAAAGLLRPAAAQAEPSRSAKAGSAKLDRLMDLLPELLEEGRRVLVFSQFTGMLALIEAALDEAGIAMSC